jgi:ABC-2 type transport system permease protein
MPFDKAFVAYMTIINSELRRMVRLWKQTILPSAVTTALYFVIFGAFIGSQVGDIGDFTYMQFIVPGLVMMAVITNAFQQTVSGFFFQKFTKSIEEMLVSPMPAWVMLSGFVTAGIVRGLVVGLVVLLLSLFFAHLSIYSFLITAIFIILTACLFSLGGLLNSLYAKTFDQIAIIPTFVLTPLTYLGGVFYSITVLPPFWQIVSKANPILYMVDGFRYGFLGIMDINVWISFGVLVAFNIGFVVALIYLFKRGAGLKN